jgi:Glu-tRNA(Gln) amidotransferase subunit E-like FAD-binding protein
LAENGKDGVIERELHNHEAFYVGSIRDTVDALSDYGITREEIRQVYNRVAPTVDC